MAYNISLSHNAKSPLKEEVAEALKSFHGVETKPDFVPEDKVSICEVK
jgi:hypothetical protein